MKKLILALLLLFASSAASGQTVVLKNSGRSFGWDYIAADIKTYAIVRFELRLDAQPYSSVGIPAIQNDAQTLPGNDTYVTPIPNTIALGNHTAVVRACTATFCTSDSLPLAFVFAEVPVPANSRVK
jgi:hypothetical protein